MYILCFINKKQPMCGIYGMNTQNYQLFWFFKYYHQSFDPGSRGLQAGGFGSSSKSTRCCSSPRRWPWCSGAVSGRRSCGTRRPVEDTTGGQPVAGLQSWTGDGCSSHVDVQTIFEPGLIASSRGYPLIVQRDSGKSLMNGGFKRKITCKWCIFHCHVWLPEGKGKLKPETSVHRLPGRSKGSKPVRNPRPKRRSNELRSTCMRRSANQKPCWISTCFSD